MKNYISLDMLPKDEIDILLDNNTGLGGFAMFSDHPTEKQLDLYVFKRNLVKVTYLPSGMIFHDQDFSRRRCYMKREKYDEIMAKPRPPVKKTEIVKEEEGTELCAEGLKIIDRVLYTQEEAVELKYIAGLKAIEIVDRFNCFGTPKFKLHVFLENGQVIELLPRGTYHCDLIAAIPKIFKSKTQHSKGNKK